MRGTCWIILLLALVLPASSRAASAGDLMIAPTRVVLEGRERTAVVNLVNRGDQEATYRISLKNMAMKEDGSYENIEEPVNGEQFAIDRLFDIFVGASQPTGIYTGTYNTTVNF